jgi:hypothetical protein
MTTQKQSRKISILVAVLILLAGIIIGGYLVLKSGRGTASELSDILNGNSLSLSGCEPNTNDSNKDSDEDGLMDWQEIQLYKTDACKPDSDGDGYLDGEEVASGYDPAKKAPGDELPGTMPKTPRPLPANLTEALRQKLTEQITQNKISGFDSTGNLLSQRELEEYPGIQRVVWEITQSAGQLFEPDPIDEGQIKISADNSRAAIEKYAAAAAAVIPATCNQTTGPDVAIFLNAMQNNDFSELDACLNAYKESYEKLKKLTVPSDLAPIHKEQLEIFSSFIKIYEGVKEINADPLKTNLALQKYQLLLEQIPDWLQRLAQFIERY